MSHESKKTPANGEKSASPASNSPIPTITEVVQQIDQTFQGIEAKLKEIASASLFTLSWEEANFTLEKLVELEKVMAAMRTMADGKACVMTLI